LFGINVGGMPGVEAKSAFWIVAITIPVLAVIEFAVLRRLKWI
jgi:zinc transporter